MFFEHSPAALDPIGLAVIGRVVGQVDREPRGVGAGNQAGAELRALAVIFGPVVQVQLARQLRALSCVAGS